MIQEVLQNHNRSQPINVLLALGPMCPLRSVTAPPQRKTTAHPTAHFNGNHRVQAFHKRCMFRIVCR
jgi:hypothetical protein